MCAAGEKKRGFINENTRFPTSIFLSALNPSSALKHPPPGGGGGSFSGMSVVKLCARKMSGVKPYGSHHDLELSWSSILSPRPSNSIRDERNRLLITNCELLMQNRWPNFLPSLVPLKKKIVRCHVFRKLLIFSSCSNFYRVFRVSGSP